MIITQVTPWIFAKIIYLPLEDTSLLFPGTLISPRGYLGHPRGQERAELSGIPMETKQGTLELQIIVISYYMESLLGLYDTVSKELEYCWRPKLSGREIHVKIVQQPALPCWVCIQVNDFTEVY